MKVLAVIVTFNRPDWLIRCLLSVLKAAQTAEATKNTPIELSIQVGINGKDLETQAALKELLPKLDRKSSIQIEEFSEKLTPGKARNLLVENAQTVQTVKPDWIYFIDDDAFVDAHVFETFYRVAQENPKAGVIGGPNLTPSGSPYFQRNLGAALSSRFATFKTVDRYLAYGQSRHCGEEALILCNLFVKQAVLSPHPFPTDLICGEENHLLRALTRQGVQMIHSPDLAVSHERRGSLSKLIKQVTLYGISRGQSMVHEATARHWAYALPSLCVLTAIALSAKWALGFGPSPLLVILCALYLILGIIAAARARKPGTSIATIASLFFWIHLSYGMGVLAGALRGAKQKALGIQPHKHKENWAIH